jgi:hypothetical protein
MTPGPPETLTTLVEEDLRPMAPWFDACGSSTTTHRGLDVSSWPQCRIDIKWSATDRERRDVKSQVLASHRRHSFFVAPQKGEGGKESTLGLGGRLKMKLFNYYNETEAEK